MQMQNAMMLASIFGPLLMILGIWMLFYHENMAKVCTSCKNTPAVHHTWGMINILLGLTFINSFNMWDWSLPLLVTLLGWFMLLRGIVTLFMPHMLMKWSSKDPAWCKMKGVIPLVWGFGLCWFAFWMTQ